MNIDITTVQASLQSKLDATTSLTESKEFLVLSRSMESIIGVIGVGEILTESETQIAAVTGEGNNQIALVSSEGTDQIAAMNNLVTSLNVSTTDTAETRTASIDMNDNLLLSPEIRDYSETVQAMSASDVDCSLGSVHTKSISTNTTLTFSNPPGAGKSSGFTLILEMSYSSVITWPASVKWAYGGVLPDVTPTGTDIFTFMTIDGGAIWYGFPVGMEMA
jgi:hypothetical protein